MSDRFKEIEGVFVVTLKNGVYREAQVYTRKGLAYIKYGSGFAAIRGHGDTSVSGLRWIDSIGGAIEKTRSYNVVKTEEIKDVKTS